MCDRKKRQMYFVVSVFGCAIEWEGVNVCVCLCVYIRVYMHVCANGCLRARVGEEMHNLYSSTHSLTPAMKFCVSGQVPPVAFL